MCADGTVTKFKGDVQAYKVWSGSITIGSECSYYRYLEPHRQQYQSTAIKGLLKHLRFVTIIVVVLPCIDVLYFLVIHATRIPQLFRHGYRYRHASTRFLRGTLSPRNDGVDRPGCIYLLPMNAFRQV